MSNIRRKIRKLLELNNWFRMATDEVLNDNKEEYYVAEKYFDSEEDFQIFSKKINILRRERKHIEEKNKHEKAVEAILSGESINDTSKIYNVDYNLLVREFVKYKKSVGIEEYEYKYKETDKKNIFTFIEEDLLLQDLLLFSRTYCKICALEYLCSLAYYYIFACTKIQYPFTWNKYKQADEEWLYEFETKYSNRISEIKFLNYSDCNMPIHKKEDLEFKNRCNKAIEAIFLEKLNIFDAAKEYDISYKTLRKKYLEFYKLKMKYTIDIYESETKIFTFIEAHSILQDLFADMANPETCCPCEMCRYLCTKSMQMDEKLLCQFISKKNSKIPNSDYKEDKPLASRSPQLAQGSQSFNVQMSDIRKEEVTNKSTEENTAEKDSEKNCQAFKKINISERQKEYLDAIFFEKSNIFDIAEKYDIDYNILQKEYLEYYKLKNMIYKFDIYVSEKKAITFTEKHSVLYDLFVLTNPQTCCSCKVCKYLCNLIYKFLLTRNKEYSPTWNKQTEKKWLHEFELRCNKENSKRSKYSDSLQDEPLASRGTSQVLLNKEEIVQPSTSNISPQKEIDPPQLSNDYNYIQDVPLASRNASQVLFNKEEIIQPSTSNISSQKEIEPAQLSNDSDCIQDEPLASKSASQVSLNKEEISRLSTLNIFPQKEIEPLQLSTDTDCMQDKSLVSSSASQFSLNEEEILQPRTSIISLQREFDPPQISDDQMWYNVRRIKNNLDLNKRLETAAEEILNNKEIVVQKYKLNHEILDKKIDILKRKTEYLQLKEKFKLAVSEISSNSEIMSVAKKYKINKFELHQEYKKFKDSPYLYEYDKIALDKGIFTYMEEFFLLKELPFIFPCLWKKYPQLHYDNSINSLMFYTLEYLRSLAYTFASTNKKQYPSTWDTHKQADEEWLFEFEMRHTKELSEILSASMMIPTSSPILPSISQSSSSIGDSV